MDAELEKLVESGKLTSHGAEQLEKLKPGSFCLQKSWGFGRVAEWNLLLNQILINFAGKKAHPMQLQYAADNLEPLAPEHFLAQKAGNLSAVKKQAKDAPAALVRNILESHGGNATVQQISDWLIGDVFTEPEWKRWWESTKKALKKEGTFVIPAKKTDPVELRTGPISQTGDLLEAFGQAHQPKQQIAALGQVVKSASAFNEPEKQLQPIVATIENLAARNQKMHPELAFELIIDRDELLERVPKLKTTHIGLTLTKLIIDEEKRLMTILPKLPAGKEKKILQALPSALGERWTVRALQLMQGSQGRMVAQIPRVLSEAGQHAELRTMIKRSVHEHSATSDMLAWLCNERDEWPELISPELLFAILSAIERDQHNAPARGSKVQRLLVDDRELIADIFRGADVGIARDAMRRLMISPVFDELTKRSLLARIVKLYPGLESMITGAQPQTKVGALIVSWSSLEKRRTEYEDLIKKKIPENIKEISLARSYGDLSENFEYKAAKQMQAVLGRRRSELERDLQNARGTKFENPDTTRVSIGTIVTLRGNSKKEEIYTILGAWDGDPDRHIISYQTAIGQALLGHGVGEVVALNSDQGQQKVTIVSIEAAPPDEAPADPSLFTVEAEAVTADAE